ncbi:MAG TPA: hypothetical protein PKN32_13595 [Bacteroidales bacterium]|nr:hypothetical protein [Bacteroidales bacterium]
MKTTHEYLVKEQQKTLETARYNYSFSAKLFFLGMDILAGRKDTLSKAKLLEILACIPYRAWEIRHYTKLTRKFRNSEKVNYSKQIVEWGRIAQDNEYWHLLVIHEKMKEEKMKDAWYLCSFVTLFAVLSYIFIARTMAFFSQKRAFLFNAEFENHAELVYAKFVKDHPELENQKQENEIVKQYTNVDTWADVFRRISLDERQHMIDSFIHCGKRQYVDKYYPDHN